jgi:hypothetical protein
MGGWLLLFDLSGTGGSYWPLWYWWILLFDLSGTGGSYWPLWYWWLLLFDLSGTGGSYSLTSGTGGSYSLTSGTGGSYSLASLVPVASTLWPVWYWWLLLFGLSGTGGFYSLTCLVLVTPTLWPLWYWWLLLLFDIVWMTSYGWPLLRLHNCKGHVKSAWWRVILQIISWGSVFKSLSRAIYDVGLSNCLRSFVRYQQKGRIIYQNSSTRVNEAFKIYSWFRINDHKIKI